VRFCHQYISSLVKCLYIFAHFLIGLFILSHLDSLPILNIKSFDIYVVGRIFLLTRSFTDQKYLILMKSSVSGFPDTDFGVKSKSSLPGLRP
jgi:hypothetical protein